MSEEICFLPATTLAASIHKREITCVELISLFLRRIEAWNETSRAFITVMADEALRQANILDRSEGNAVSAPFIGVPLAVKDLIDVKGVPTTGGSRVLQGHIAQENALVVGRLLGAGAIDLGKANLHEFAYGTSGENPHFGTCVNAFDMTRLACGSSSGSAAAVAFGLAAAGLGTDTGGSVRIPAVLNGLVGLKPTYGLIPTTGIIPFSWSLDHVGLITRTVRDCAAMLAICSGHAVDLVSRPPENGISLSLAGIRIGVLASLRSDRLDPSIYAAVEAVGAFLSRLGAELVEISLPDLVTSRTASLTIQMPEALSFHSRYLEDHGELYGHDFRAGLALGQCLLADHYLRAKRFAVALRREVDQILSGIEVILTPATAIPAPKIGTTHVTIDGEAEPIGNALTRYTSLFNLTGHPAVALPCGMHPEGVPIGIQIVGRHFDEARILRVAQLIADDRAFAIPRPAVT